MLVQNNNVSIIFGIFTLSYLALNGALKRVRARLDDDGGMDIIAKGAACKPEELGLHFIEYMLIQD